MENQTLPIWKTVRFVLNNLLAFEFYQLYLKALLFYQDKVILILVI